MTERFRIALSTEPGVEQHLVWTYSPALMRLTSRFRRVPGGELKPRPDHNDGCYHGKSERTGDTKRVRVERTMMKARIGEALSDEPVNDGPQEVKQEPQLAWASVDGSGFLVLKSGEGPILSISLPPLATQNNQG